MISSFDLLATKRTIISLIHNDYEETFELTSGSDFPALRLNILTSFTSETNILFFYF